jgi:hypothetical protein
MLTRTLLAAVLALVLIGGASTLPAAAQEPDPGELWEEFPLEPSPTPTQPVATPTERVRVVRTESATDWFGIVSLMVLGAGLGAMSASLARGRRRSRAHAPAHEPGPSAVAPQTAPKPGAPPAARAPEPQRQRTGHIPTRTAATPPPPGAAPRAPRPAAPGPPRRLKPAAPEPRTKLPPPAPQRPAQRTAPLFERARAKSEWESCRIQLWHGYVKKQFYAESPDRDAWIAWSPYFRVEKGSAIEESEQAEAALAELIDTLVADGWEVTGRREGTLEVALRRRTVAARPASRQPVD